jgi:transcriptional pleiotropic regulator of transition state genes
MCIGMANGGKMPEFINGKSRIDDLGRIQIPKEMRKKLGINEGDTLRLTATGNIIVIEKCEDDEE